MSKYFRALPPKPLAPYWHDSEDRKIFIAATKDKGWTREYVVKYNKAGSYVRVGFAKPQERLALEFLPARQLTDMELGRRARRELALSSQGWKIVYLQPTSDGKLLLVGSYDGAMIAKLLMQIFGSRLEVI